MRRRKPSPIFTLCKEHLLSSDSIKRAALLQVVGNKADDHDYIKTHFSDLVLRTESKAYEIFLESQQKAGPIAITEYLSSKLPKNFDMGILSEVITNSFDDIDSFFLSLSQSRKARAGYAFQFTIRELLLLLEYPFVEQPVINGQPDFLFPSVEYFQKNSIDCIIFTVKRIIRERWRQVTNEGTRGLGFYLATIDDKVTARELPRIKDNKINLVVPASIKENVPHYREAEHVITFETFILDKLDPSVKAWKRRGII